jgi:hypothetical protein
MMLEEDGVHPDEGTIHAWLDGALNAQESARLEAHVSGCGACASRVAEARGLIAGASRVAGLLDEQPAPLIKPASTPTVGTERSVWRLLRVTPARASIAALLVVAVGIALTHGHLGVDTRSVEPAVRSGQQQVQVLRGARDNSDAAMAPVASAAPPIRDSVLNSAIARRLATEQPSRTMAAASGVATPTPPVVVASTQTTNFSNAEASVLAGRASIVAQRETAGIRADRTRAGVGQLSAGAAVASERVTVAAKAADSVGRSARWGRTPGVAPSVAPAECYRVESASPATWGSVHLPMIVALDSAGTGARILTASGGETETRAFLQYNGADSALFLLQRIGFSGSMTLGSAGAIRSGTVRSSAVRDELGGAAAIAVTARLVSCPAP